MGRIYAVTKGSPRKALAAIGVLVLSIAVAVGSGANFNSTSANPGNTFTAGNLTHTNSKDGSAILTASGMVPGDSSTGTVDITNTGDVNGVFTLSDSALTGAAFAAVLDLTVEDCGTDLDCGVGASSTLYSGKLDSLPASVALGTFAPGVGHRYQFTVDFPDGGAGGADNALQGASSSVQYDWESVNE